MRHLIPWISKFKAIGKSPRAFGLFTFFLTAWALMLAHLMACAFRGVSPFSDPQMVRTIWYSLVLVFLPAYSCFMFPVLLNKHYGVYCLAFGSSGVILIKALLSISIALVISCQDFPTRMAMFVLILRQRLVEVNTLTGACILVYLAFAFRALFVIIQKWGDPSPESLS